MGKYTLLLLFVPIVFFGCKKCVECEIKLKESQQVLGYVDEFCGTDKKVKAEEERLLADYTCVECIVNTGLGPATSGIQCGDRLFTDSLEADWRRGAFDLGTTANCTYYRDTVNVTCLLK